ncbi:coiled-coil-helix-coiled-coil-helix domain-containing protein 5 [Passer montanus]|uniref:coiled-coil-helix-coiled-coil-helix domain-containing protein 5 n=1 Tax=Passer montanus TaxID=9160 RepID=UPI001960FCAB|nr:coiled-coil-helix-coiled-coil-helix domain-containing protein 5 [Passer montanus]
MEALAVTAQLCGPELERYGRCVAASPGSWHRDCHQLSLSVTECASGHPLVRRIRRDCSESFGAFERCLRERPRGTAQCGPQASQFLLCAQNVTQNVTQSATPSASPGDATRGTSTENPWN